MYGFRKVVTTEAVNVKVGKDDLEFAHPHFIRCHEELLELTKRKNTAELKNRTSDVTDETINVESIDAQTSQETELFADILVILKSVIGFLHESNFLTNKSLIQRELMKWLPTVADFELECYITCIWFTAHCLTSENTTSLPDVTTITQTVQRVSGFCTPIIVEPSLECHSNAPAVVETSASTTYSAVASCTETDADGFLPTNSKTAQPAIDGVEQSDAVVPTGCDCVEIMTRVKTERNDECEIIASSSSVCGVNPDIILNTGDLPVAVTSTEAVTSAAAAGKTVESGRSEFECNRIKYELKDCYVLLERLDQHPPGNARADVENIIPDMPTTEAVSVQSLVHELIDQSHVTPFHDERTVLTRDYSTEGLREESRNLTAVQTLLPTELSSSYAPREKPYKCSFCVSSFFRPYDLSRHELIHTGEKKHKCNVCGASFFRGDHLREHERIHTGEKPFKCQVCGSSFARSSDQRKHESKHAYKRTFNLTEKKPVRCSICGASFPGFSSLRFHRRTVHGGDIMPFKCQLCGASFSSVDGLRSHETKHTNFTCKICGDSFRLFSELRSHIKTSHAGEKVTCKTCGLVCAKPATLRTHQLTHTGEKHFKCNTCGVSFAQRGSLSRHELTHTGEKPHKCKTCGAGFTQSGHLRAHEFLHTGIKPHVCSTCNQAFAHRRHLVRHVRRRHEKMSLKSSPVVVWHAVNTTEVTESGSHLLPSGEVVQPKVEATYAVSQETAVKTIVF